MTFTSSNSSEELLQIARNAIISGHRATAARMVNRVLEKEPTNQDAWRLLAECMTDPQAKRKCLIKAGDIPANNDKSIFKSERFTTTPSHRIELPPPESEQEAQPIILEPRKNKTSQRAENPLIKPGRNKSQPPRTARTRKTDPKRRKKSGCGTLIILLLLIAALAAGGYFYFKPDISLDSISAVLFPSTNDITETDPSVDDLIPPDELPVATETPAPDPDASQLQDEESNPDEASAGLIENVVKIGESVEGRPIEVYQFGSGEIQRLIVAGMHGGNEYNTIDLADELIAYIRDNPEVIPPDKTLFILRNLNPDGEARAHGVDGRTNKNGVDLNRNWDSHWKIDWDRTGCWTYRPVTGGPFPASEPETSALLGFINNNHIDAIINYHSAALGIFPGGQPWEAASILLSEDLHEATGYSYPPIDTGCEFTGMFTDWAADHGIPAVDIELTNHSDSDFDQNLRAMNVLLAWSPDSAAKSIPGEPGAEDVTQEQDTILTQVQDKATEIFNEVYGLILSNFEER